MCYTTVKGAFMNNISTLILTDKLQTSKLLKLYLNEFDCIDLLEERKDHKSILYTLSSIPGNSIFIIDVSEKKTEKFELIKKVSAQCSNCEIIVLSDNPTVDLIVQIMRTGAHDFVPVPLIKNDFMEIMNKAISAIDSSRKVVNCKIISVFSNKGGLGKTTLATNLALELSKVTNENVALLDMNFQMGDITTFLDIKPSFNISYMLENIDKINETFLLSTLEKYRNSKLYILADPPYFKQAGDISPDKITKLFKILKETFSYIVVDAEASFEDKNISVLDMSDTILLVTVTNMPALKNTQRCLEFFDKLNYDSTKVKLIVNRYMETDEIKIEDIVKLLSKPVYRAIPNDYNTMMSAVNKGIPVCAQEENTEVAKSYTDLAKDISENFNKESMAKKFENIYNKY